MQAFSELSYEKNKELHTLENKEYILFSQVYLTRFTKF